MTWTYFEIFKTYSTHIHTVRALRFSPAEKVFLSSNSLLSLPDRFMTHLNALDPQEVSFLNRGLMDRPTSIAQFTSCLS